MTLASYPWMLDLLVGVILLACACIKGVKGIYKSLMPLAVIVASVICATFLSAILTEPVTEMVYPIAEDKLISALKIDKLPQEDLQQFANLVTNPDTLAKKIEEMLPKGMLPVLSKLGVDVREFAEQTLEDTKDSVDIHDYLSEEQIEKLKDAGVELQTAAATAVGSTKDALAAEGAFFSTVFSLTYRLTAIAVHYLLWGIFCVLFLALLTIIKNTFGLAFDLPVIGWVDKLGGALLGVVEAGLVMFVIGWLARLFEFNTLHDLGAGTTLFALFF